VSTQASNLPYFTCGAKVQLISRNHESMNRDWLLVSVTHTGKQPQALEQEAGVEPTTHHTAFSAIPANKTWRPDLPQGDGFEIRPQSRSLPRPVMDGPQVAIVTGPEGEEIHCDQHGRVKGPFPLGPAPAAK
jgi:type VI secretion system secreted protein VgrG